VSRWPTDARERLEAAALDLFVENGYEETTVADITERADLNRATFFRHFTDKREVLFGGEDKISNLLTAGVQDAPPSATLAECLVAGFEMVDEVLTPEQRTKSVQRILVMKANTEVQERALLKHARTAAAISAAFRDRGTPELTARLAAELGMLAFSIALAHWVASDDGEAFIVDAKATLEDLQSRAPDLQTRPSSHAV
jgi:AcrR family transcriptional regulator